MAEIGERVRVESRKLGQAVREGVVTGVTGHMLRVQWSTGEESTFMPGPGSVRVVGKVRARASKRAPGKTAVAPSKRASGKKAAAVKKPSRTATAKKTTAKKTPRR